MIRRKFIESISEEANNKILADLKFLKKQVNAVEILASNLFHKLEKRNDSLDSDLLESLPHFVSDCEGLWDTLAERIDCLEDPNWNH